jgi:uncharacterized protein
MTFPSPALPVLEPSDFDELDAILDDMRSRMDETPQWEFCEGFMAAILCCRRPLSPQEYLPVLLGLPAPDQSPSDDDGSFADVAQAERFSQLWQRRLSEVQTALEADVENLEDEACYSPELIDVRSAVADMSAEEQALFSQSDLPSFAQVWALGFMFAVECWPQEWDAPRDKDLAKVLDESLGAIISLTLDDTDEPTISPLFEDGPPTTSVQRFNALADAIWAVYTLREIWRELGPRIDTVRKPATPGRNDACPCGSGKKYKKCCSAS